jgi:hypothetical protein
MMEERAVGLEDDVAGAFRALHLLPSAPRALVDDIYRALRNGRLAQGGGDAQVSAQLERLSLAHEAIVAHATSGVRLDVAIEHSPWALLHLDRDAPPEIVELAYRYRQGLRGDDVTIAAQPIETHERVAPVAEREDVLPTTPPSSVPIRLAVETGTARPPHAAIGESPLRIGGDPTCDIVVAVTEARKGRTEARLWRRRGRVVFHGVAGHTLVNGHAVGWAVLDTGDTIQVADAVFRLEG